MFGCFCLHVHLGTMCMQYPFSTEEGRKSWGTGVTGSLQLGTGNPNWALGKSVCVLTSEPSCQP